MSDDNKNIDASFEKFYATYFPKVKNFAYLLTKSRHDAEDIAQNIFMKLWMRPDVWHETGPMSGYLYVMTRNEIFAHFRHQKIESDYEAKISRSRLFDELCDGDTSLLENIYYKEMVLLVRMALSQMPGLRREAFELSRFEGMSNKEISEKLQISQRTVEDYIYKTLMELRKVLMFVILLRILP